MQVTADANEISKNAQHDVTFILNIFQILVFILPSFQ